MVIQRWQSVWLLVAAILVALFCFLPMAYVSMEGPEIMNPDSVTFMYPSDNWVMLIVGLLVTALLIINIFSFKDTRRQKMMTIVAVILIAVLAVCACLMVNGFQGEGAKAEWMGSILLLAGAVVFALLAYRGISHDEKLLKAADRLR